MTLHVQEAWNSSQKEENFSGMEKELNLCALRRGPGASLYGAHDALYLIKLEYMR